MKPAVIHPSLEAFARQATSLVAPKGPLAIVLCEDGVEIASTVTHALKIGFDEVFVFGNRSLLPDPQVNVHLIDENITGTKAAPRVVNAMIKALPGRWLHYCFNAEYLHFPFCETRNVAELITFNMEERRDTVLSYVIDLYSRDLGAHPDAVCVDDAYFDAAGYYALQRMNKDSQAIDRQHDFHGGLRWRFEEHVPWERRKIDRVSLFRAKSGLELREDHTFNDAEYNTFACPWHHNITAALCSFRTAKALLSNPGSMYEIPHLWWEHSTRFDWSSRQLLDLGMMEPGQWF